MPVATCLYSHNENDRELFIDYWTASHNISMFDAYMTANGQTYSYIPFQRRVHLLEILSISVSHSSSRPSIELYDRLLCTTDASRQRAGNLTSVIRTNKTPRSMQSVTNDGPGHIQPPRPYSLPAAKRPFLSDPANGRFRLPPSRDAVGCGSWTHARRR